MGIEHLLTPAQVVEARAQAKREYLELDRRLHEHGNKLAEAAAGAPFCKACGHWAEVRGPYRFPCRVSREGAWHDAIESEPVPLCLNCARLTKGARVVLVNYYLDPKPTGVIAGAEGGSWVIDCDDGERRNSHPANMRVIEDDAAGGS